MLREGVNFDADQLNVIELTELGVSMDAIGDKIMILVDEYKTGYECKNCGGTGRVKSTIVADATSQCPDCQGKGAILVVPENARSMPSTGVIVSMGPKTEYIMLKHANSKTADDCVIKIGTRVCFGVHVGTKIPIKGNIRLVIMREHEPLCRIFGSNIADKEILDYSADPINT